jgi:hypothetical protein
MRRPRGPGGRFLTAAEVASQKSADEEGATPSGTLQSQASSSSHSMPGMPIPSDAFFIPASTNAGDSIAPIPGPLPVPVVNAPAANIAPAPQPAPRAFVRTVGAGLPPLLPAPAPAVPQRPFIVTSQQLSNPSAVAAAQRIATPTQSQPGSAVHSPPPLDPLSAQGSAMQSARRPPFPHTHSHSGHTHGVHGPHAHMGHAHGYMSPQAASAPVTPADVIQGDPFVGMTDLADGSYASFGQAPALGVPGNAPLSGGFAHRAEHVQNISSAAVGREQAAAALGSGTSASGWPGAGAVHASAQGPPQPSAHASAIAMPATYLPLPAALQVHHVPHPHAHSHHHTKFFSGN